MTANASPLEYAGKPSASLLSLPMPSVETGTDGYRKAVRILKEGYDRNGSTIDKVNIATVAAALSVAQTTSIETLGPAEKATVLTGRALLALHNGDHALARKESTAALLIALHKLEPDAASLDTVSLWEDLTLRLPAARGWLSPKKLTAKFRERDVVPIVSLPASIWAIATLADPKIDPNVALAALRAALASDSKNILVPLALSAYMDRLEMRATEDFPAQMRAIYSSVDRVMADTPERTRSLAILAVRVLVRMELNRLTVDAGVRGRIEANKIRGTSARAFFDRVTKDQAELLHVGEVVVAAIKGRDGIAARDVEGIGHKLDEHRKNASAFETSAQRAIAKL